MVVIVIPVKPVLPALSLSKGAQSRERESRYLPAACPPQAESAI